jgi:hypothetical protein
VLELLQQNMFGLVRALIKLGIKSNKKGNK